MSVPLHTFTVVPVTAAFLPPLDEPYDPLYMRATGGIAIGDGSQGREVQFWTVVYGSGGVISVQAELSGTPGYELAVDGVLSVCLAFDSNMAVALSYMKADGGYLYFYNGLINDYQTNYYPEATSCRVVVDKTTEFFNAQSDVIFAYTDTSDELHYRQQRDRYTIEYDVPGGSAGWELIRLGPSFDNRLQFQLLPFTV